MCGICGIYGHSDKELLKKMTNIMAHRGPDDKGYFLDKNIMLGQRRLSIIDLKTGKQPIFNEDGSIVVILNGEIYNYIELKKELEYKGHEFSTKSDTEVIVHAYEEYGEKCLTLFNGMFGLALYDLNKKKLILARDRVGIKPMYYTKINKKVIFGSEIKSILEYSEVKREVDKDAFHDFINIRYNPGIRTMFKGISKLLPGHYIICDDNNNIKIKKYWDLKINIKDNGIKYFEKKLDENLKNSIKIQLRSDVPVGLLLSSGLDSSTLAAYASKFSDKIKTYTMGFGESTDECDAAQKIANHLGLEHKNLIIKNDFLKDFKKLIWHMDQPKRNLYPYYIYNKLKGNVKVVLSGLGGDELLGGYTFRYKYMLNAQKFRKLIPQSSWMKKILKKPVKYGINSWVKFNSEKGNIIKDIYLDKLNNILNIYTDSGTYYKITTADSGFNAIQFKEQIYSSQMKNVIGPHVRHFDQYFKQNNSLIDNTYLAEFKEKLPNDFLVVDDAMSMANSVESRVPFLDNKLIDLCFSMPNKYKFNGNVGKLILRKNIKKLLPEKLLFKGKLGFSSNTHSIYKNELRQIAQEKLINGQAVKNKFIKKEFIQKILSTKTNMNKTRYYNFIWNLYAFEEWWGLYLDK
jgi:asparagine synthase (glutamine-hydrolysing)